ncbi:MAG: hypothetical protein M3463_21325 [Verrucomicrobiota bacterium]|nr:hypothetical protein [Verrucomicrobiota bacterium]
MGVTNWSLGRWVQQANAGQTLKEPNTLDAENSEQDATSTAAFSHEELRRLRQELEYVSRQRDILQKSLGILSAEMPPHASR